MTGKLKSGFEFHVNDNVFDNMELVETIVEAKDDDPTAAYKLVKMILGTDQKAALYDHLRAEDGRVPVAAVFAAIAEIFESCSEGKNS